MVSWVEQDVWPPDRVVVPPGVQSRELRQRSPRLWQQGAGFGAHLLPLPLPPRVLLGLMQGVQGVGVIDMGVRVLALVVRKRLVGWREVGRLEIRGRGVRQRRGTGIRSLGDRAQLGQSGAVAGNSIVPVLVWKEWVGERDRKNEGLKRQFTKSFLKNYNSKCFCSSHQY